jgi:hypothetical protein
VPLMTNINVTAMAASRVESRFVTAIEVVIRRFCIDLEDWYYSTQDDC